MVTTKTPKPTWSIDYYFSVPIDDDCGSSSQRHFRTSWAMNPSSSVSSAFSIFDNLETDRALESFSSVSGTLAELCVSGILAGVSWELKDLLSKDDNVGSDCPDEGGPANEAGWKSRLGMCWATRERT